MEPIRHLVLETSSPEPMEQPTPLPKFEFWSIKRGEVSQKPDPEKLYEIDEAAGTGKITEAQRYQELALYVMELSGQLKSEDAITAELHEINETSATITNAKTRDRLSKTLGRLQETDLAGVILPPKILEMVGVAQRYQQPENATLRKQMLERTAQFDNIPPIKRLRYIRRQELIGPVAERVVGDALRLLAAELQNVELDLLPTYIRSVE